MIIFPINAFLSNDAEQCGDILCRASMIARCSFVRKDSLRFRNRIVCDPDIQDSEAGGENGEVTVMMYRIRGDNYDICEHYSLTTQRTDDI